MMTNLTNDRISVEISAAAEQQVKDGIQMIQNALPFLVGLTPAAASASLRAALVFFIPFPRN